MDSATRIALWDPVMVTFLQEDARHEDIDSLLHTPNKHWKCHLPFNLPLPIWCPRHEITPIRDLYPSSAKLHGKKQTVGNQPDKTEYENLHPTWLISIILLPPRPTTNPTCSSAIPIVTELLLSSCSSTLQSIRSHINRTMRNSERG